MLGDGRLLGYIGLTIAGLVTKLLLAAQIVFAFAFHGDGRAIPLIYSGYVLLALAVIIGGVSFLSLFRWGRSRSRILPLATTAIVDRGIYGTVRHPMFLIAMIMAVSLMLIGQQLTVIVMGCVEIVLLCLAVIWEEGNLREKFGEDYERYARSVPALNLPAGLMRYLHRRL